MKNKRNEGRANLIGLGVASKQTRAMTYGADDSKGGLWFMPGLSLD